MNKNTKHVFQSLIIEAKRLIVEGQLQEAFQYLEKAHVIGQRYVIPHTISHWYMLKIGMLRKDFKEIFGQLIRIPLGILGSFIGAVPLGNTGGSNVSIFQKMDIPMELKEILEQHNCSKD